MVESGAMDSNSRLRADDPGLAAAVARNLGEALGNLHGGRPEAVVEQAADLVFADSGLDDPTFNGVACARFDPRTAHARIGQVLDRMAATGRPFVWWVDPAAQPADLGARLLAAGLAQDERLPWLIRPLETPIAGTGGAKRGEESGLVVREVRTAEEWADFVSVLCSCWDPPRPGMRRFLSSAYPSVLAPDAAGRFLVGYVEDAPVCTAEALLYADVAGLYNIVTLPEHQRRGYGTAITLAALELARDAGYRTATLQASAQGEPVYRRLGFEQVGEYLLYGIGG